MDQLAVTIKMSIPSLAKLSFVGLVYIYAVKLIDSFFHGLFRPAAFAGVVVALSILAGVVQFLFFVEFYRQLVPQGKFPLKIAAWLAICGAAAGLFPKFLAMSLLLQTPILFPLIRHSQPIAAFFPWLSATLLFLFGLTFSIEYHGSKNRNLFFSLVAGAVGWLIMAAAQSLVTVNYATSGRVVWLSDLLVAGPVVFVGLSSLTLVGLSIFFIAFSKVLPSDPFGCP